MIRDNEVFNLLCNTSSFLGANSRGCFAVKQQLLNKQTIPRCILSTDLGQINNPAPVAGMRMMIAAMLDNGLTEKEIEIMVKTNPARLLGLD